MSEGYKSPNNCGCIVAFLIGTPLLLLVILIGILTGGGCEGVGPNCHPNYSPLGLVILVMLVGAFALAWGLNSIANRSRVSVQSQALQVADAIRAFLDGTGNDWDWDNFTSCPLPDSKLDSIRRRAGAIHLPAGEEELQILRALAEEAENLARHE